MQASGPTLRRSKRLLLKQAGADEDAASSPPMVVVDRLSFDEVDDYDQVAARALKREQRQEMRRRQAQAFLRGVTALGGEHDLHAENHKRLIEATLASYLLPESSEEE
jgi:hypothetical protein